MLSNSNMHPNRQLFAGTCCVVLLIASQAEAQPAAPAPPEPQPDTLETPYGDAPAPAATAPPPPPAAPPPSATVPPPSAAAQPPATIKLSGQLPSPDKRPSVPIRARRKLALLGEVSWNGLAGFGPVLVYYADPHVALDLGVGFSLMGGKIGARARYNFLTSPFTPFLGVGFIATSGLGQFTTDPSQDPKGDPNREPATIDVKPAHLVQGVFGFDFVHRRGFSMLGCVGWAWQLDRNNVHLLAGTLTPDERQGFNLAFKGGLVLSTAFGYAFQ
jgi:hypothetical protein